MTLFNVFDCFIVVGQGALALLLWHRAEPRMRLARGVHWTWCINSLGLALAASVWLTVLRFQTDDPMHWQRTIKDLLILLHAACVYRHALRVMPVLEVPPAAPAAATGGRPL